MLNSRLYNDLVEPFRQKAMRTVVSCQERGLEMLVASTLRDLESQAALYRTNRTRAQIAAKCVRMRAAGWGALADVIERVGPQRDDGGGVVTNAGPGESWHNYGLAMDAYPLVGGKLATDRPIHTHLWNVYGEEARKAGLSWAGNWPTFRELPHIQLGSGSNPLKTMTKSAVLGALAKWL